MKIVSLKTEWIIWVIILIPLAFLAITWPQLPEIIPTHFNIHGEADDWSNKNILLWMAPMLTILPYLLLLVVPYIDPKKRLTGMGKKYFIIRLLIASLLSLITVFVIYSGMSGKVSFSYWLFPVISVFLIILGNYMQSVKPNYFIGIRTPWTLQDDQIWQRTHRLGGRVFMIGGALLLILSLLIRKEMSHIAYVLIIMGIAMIPVVYSFILYMQSQKTKKQ